LSKSAYDISNLEQLDDETELDIDTFSNPVLSRLHDLIIKNVPGIVPAKSEPARPAKPSKPKKNKPMSKTEQEAKIEKLKKLKDQFERQGSTSDDAPASRIVQCKYGLRTLIYSILIFSPSR
jgi:bromodomain-containing factor 1